MGTHWNPALESPGKQGQEWAKIMNSQSSEHISHVCQEGNVGAPNPRSTNFESFPKMQDMEIIPARAEMEFAVLPNELLLLSTL